MPPTTGRTLQPDVPAVRAAEPHPVRALARGDAAAIIVRQAFPAQQCAALIERLIGEELMFAYFFNTGLIHEVPGVPGDRPRVVLATFIGYSDDDEEVMVWS